MMWAPLVVLLVSVVVMAPGTANTEESRVALVVGNGAYKSAPLSTSINDAQAMDEALKTLSFDVVQRTDVSRREFRILIRGFGDRLRKSGAVGLFYYSGHGMQVNGRNYMIPIDADIQSEVDVEDDGVTVDSVLAQMEAANSNPNIVILDACRDNPFEKRFKSTQKGLASIGAPGGTLIAYATAPGEVADSGPPRGNSPFTAILVREIVMPAPNAWVTFNRVAKRVIDITGGQQKPYLEISAYFPDFSFKPLLPLGDTEPQLPPPPRGDRRTKEGPWAPTPPSPF